MFDGLKARLERLLAEAGHQDTRARSAALREAVIEARAGLAVMRQSLAAVERELAAEQRQLADAERRGRLAAEVPDPETVAVAERFAARHRERVALLERKAAVQRDELALAEREAESMASEYRATLGAAGAAQASAAQAWRDLEAAGGSRPETDPSDEQLRREADRAAREAAVDAQLAFLKKKLGKDR